MELVEMSEKQQVSREEAAARLRTLADALARHNEVEFDRGGLRVKVRVPDRVSYEVEVEVDEDGGELEVELSW